MRCSPNPSGLCMCGCGGRTPIATKNDLSRGTVLGEPRRFIARHHAGMVERHTVERRGHETPCWIWQGKLSDKGYGRGPFLRPAHRVAWERVNGPVPEGLELDHLCRVRACVNPTHLEPVTHAENVLRGTLARLAKDERPLVRARVEARMSQSDVAAALGVTQSLVCRWETGRSGLPPHRQAALEYLYAESVAA